MLNQVTSYLSSQVYPWCKVQSSKIWDTIRPIWVRYHLNQSQTWGVMTLCFAATVFFWNEKKQLEEEHENDSASSSVDTGADLNNNVPHDAFSSNDRWDQPFSDKTRQSAESVRMDFDGSASGSGSGSGAVEEDGDGNSTPHQLNGAADDSLASVQSGSSSGVNSTALGVIGELVNDIFTAAMDKLSESPESPLDSSVLGLQTPSSSLSASSTPNVSPPPSVMVYGDGASSSSQDLSPRRLEKEFDEADGSVTGSKKFHAPKNWEELINRIFGSSSWSDESWQKLLNCVDLSIFLDFNHYFSVEDLKKLSTEDLINYLEKLEISSSDTEKEQYRCAFLAQYYFMQQNIAKANQYVTQWQSAPQKV